MNELGSGTDPTEGMGIAVAIFGELRKSGEIFLVTTHCPEVKEYAKKTEDISNARMTFDKETLSPTYQMVLGEAGESCAFYIADRLGMPNEMLKVVICAAYGEETVRTYEFQKPDYEEAAKKRYAVQNGSPMVNRKGANKLTRMKISRKQAELYPEDYDFSIIFDSVENRKKRHDM